MRKNNLYRGKGAGRAGCVRAAGFGGRLGQRSGNENSARTGDGAAEGFSVSRGTGGILWPVAQAMGTEALLIIIVSNVSPCGAAPSGSARVGSLQGGPTHRVARAGVPNSRDRSIPALPLPGEHDFF